MFIDVQLPHLEGTELSLAEIAERSGYQSEVAFRKAFRSVVGEPPGRLRRTRRALPKVPG